MVNGDLSSLVRNLQENIALVQKEKMQSEILRERAQMKLDSAVEKLSSSFNVSNLEEAKSKLNELEEEVRKNIALAEDALRKTDG